MNGIIQVDVLFFEFGLLRGLKIVFFLVVSKIRFAMFQKTLKLLDDFDEYF